MCDQVLRRFIVAVFTEHSEEPQHLRHVRNSREGAPARTVNKCAVSSTFGEVDSKNSVNAIWVSFLELILIQSQFELVATGVPGIKPRKHRGCDFSLNPSV